MKNRSFLQSLSNAVDGIISAIKAEQNMKVHLFAAASVLILSFLFDLSIAEILILCITIAFVIVCELFNTAIELVVDMIVSVNHPKAKAIKDISAGAVLVSAFLSLIIGYFIFFPRIGVCIETGISGAKNVSVYVFISIIVMVILILFRKGFTAKGKLFHSGMPSGLSALAFSIATSISLLTENAYVTILCIILSFLVVQSRLEAKIQKPSQLITGGILGILVTLLIFRILA